MSTEPNIGTLTGNNNLIEDGTCALTANVSGDPVLGSLQDNGGQTWTMALLAGSPAIDAADTAAAPATDQRGVIRPQGSEADIGAYEADADTTPPAAPIVTAPISGTVTNINPPTFIGTGEPGATITITDEGGNPICTTTVDGSGDWTCTPSSPLPEGEQTVNVTATDPAGNESVPTPVTVTVDTTPPAAPAVTEPISGTVTNVNPPTFVGTGEPGATITITDGGGNPICTTAVDGNGDWTCTPSSPLPEGEQTVNVTATDPAGNESDPTPVTVTVDTTPPAAPAVTEPISGTVTNVNPPTFVGTGEPGSTITITDGDGNPICTTTVDSNGDWTCTPSSPLPEGEQTVNVTATDPAGNESDPTPVTVTVDTTPPAAPVVTSPTDGDVTSDTTPTFIGTGNPGDTITVTDGGGNPICTTTVDVNGDWSCTPSSPLPEGTQTFNVTATDAVGNESDPTPILLTIDTIAPVAPTVTAPISGTLTNDNTPTFIGTAEANSTVIVYDENGNVVCTTTAAANGDWSCTAVSPLPDGSQTFDVTATDAAGNESDPMPVAVTIDTVAPDAPTVTSPISGTTTIDLTPTFTGTGEPGATIEVRDGSGALVCTAVVDSNGDWSCTPSSPLPYGASEFDVTATDPAGNTSDPMGVSLTVNYGYFLPVVFKD